MTTIQLYKKDNAIGPVQTEGSELYGSRLIAESGKKLKKTGTEETAFVIDIYPGDNSEWTEIDYTEPEEDADWETIGQILAGAE